MVNKKAVIFTILSLSFLLFSFYPTIFELQRKDKLADSRREFILEHNYYWPDYNLYLSKIRQGRQGHLTAVEKYTSEPHQGSLIQEFYVVLGWLGKIFNLSPNDSYLLGRIILAPLLLIVIILLVQYYFPLDNSPSPPLTLRGGRGALWQILAFLIVITSGSFPRFYSDNQGILHTGRFMEWWSNIDALQRITFIPHILFGQIISFFLLYQFTLKQISPISQIRLIILILLGNLAGLTFPPSLITLNSVLLLTLILGRGGTKEGSSESLKTPRGWQAEQSEAMTPFRVNLQGEPPMVKGSEKSDRTPKLIFIIFTAPSLLYIFFITKFTPWSALVDFHRTHPMMIPFDQYILGTGPIFFLGIIGAVISIVKRERRFQPLIFWVLATFGFAAFFSVIKDQSPLRFTQTGLFIPLGILGAYLLYHVFQIRQIRLISLIGVTLYLAGSLYMMKTSLDWQTDWISQRIGANVPDVPYPPQTMYPLRQWVDGIRWLRNNTNHEDVILAEITAANHIPAYSGNFVYWGQSNTVDYERKQEEVSRFFRGKMSENEAKIFLRNGRIKYIFFSIQEKEMGGGKSLEEFYPFIKSVYNNPLVSVYSY